MFPYTVHCISVQAYDRYYCGPRTYLIQSLFYPLRHIHPLPTPQISDLATEITFLISHLYRKIQMALFQEQLQWFWLNSVHIYKLMKFIYSVLAKTKNVKTSREVLHGEVITWGPFHVKPTHKNRNSTWPFYISVTCDKLLDPADVRSQSSAFNSM